MNGITNIPANPAQVALQPPQGDVQGLQAQPQGAPAVGAGPALAGAGALAGHQVAVGEGQARNQALGFFRAVAQGFKAVGQEIAGFFSPDKYADRTFETTHRVMIRALTLPTPGGLANTHLVMQRVIEHAHSQGTPLDAAALRDLVAAGERLAQALTADPLVLGSDGRSLKVMLDGHLTEIKSSMFTTRALAWYMMAAAAHQDLERARLGQHTDISDMTTSGSFVMKDPNHNIYNFLAAEPTAATRTSTHFNAERAHEDMHWHILWFFRGQPNQRGIEDYRNKLPGKGGTMLFDKIMAGKSSGNESQALFVKFESVGCPPFFRWSSPYDVTGRSVTRFFAALGRNLGHVVSFLNSRGASGATEGQITRQEHVYKGPLRDPIAEPYATLVRTAAALGVITDDESRELASGMKEFGLPLIEQAVTAIVGNSQLTRGDLDALNALRGQANALLRQIGDAKAELGVASDRHGIVRRGAEVHISMNPAKDYPQLDPDFTFLTDMQTHLRRPQEQVPYTDIAQQFFTDLGRATYSVYEPYQPTHQSTVGVRFDRAAVVDEPHQPTHQLTLQLERNNRELFMHKFRGDSAMFSAVTQVAHQGTLSPLTRLLAEGHIDLGDGLRGVPSSANQNTRYDIVFQEDRSVCVNIAQSYPNIDGVIVNGEMQPTDRNQSNLTFRFTLNIAASPQYTVTLARQLDREGSVVRRQPEQ